MIPIERYKKFSKSVIRMLTALNTPEQIKWLEGRCQIINLGDGFFKFETEDGKLFIQPDVELGGYILFYEGKKLTGNYNLSEIYNILSLYFNNNERFNELANKDMTHLTKKSTRELLNSLRATYGCGVYYPNYEYSTKWYYTDDEIKEILKTRPHIESKEERRNKINQAKGLNKKKKKIKAKSSNEKA